MMHAVGEGGVIWDTFLQEMYTHSYEPIIVHDIFSANLYVQMYLITYFISVKI